MELFLRLFKADTEEEMEALEKTEVEEVAQMVDAYRDIVNSEDYGYLERRRLMERLDRGQELRHARNEGRNEGRIEGEALANAVWQSLVADMTANIADKDANIADKDAEIARLRAQLGIDTHA